MKFSTTRIVLVLLVASVLLGSIASVAIADTANLQVDGTVKDAGTGGAISGASITSDFGLSGSTGSSGYYLLGGTYNLVNGATYHVTASASGYNSQTQSFVYHTGDGGPTLNYQLTTSNPATATPNPATATPNPATATPNPATATPNPATATPNPGTPTPTSQSTNGDPASYSSNLITVVTDTPTPTPSPTAEPTVTPTPTAAATVTVTPIPLPTTTAQTSPDWTCLLFLVLLLIAFVIGYLAGRKHEQMKQNKKEQDKQP